MLDLMFGDDDKPVTCAHCKWTGPLSQTRKREVSSPPSAWHALAGREGWEFDCPQCGWTVEHIYTRMS